jgi:hypothetical protein
VAYKKLKAAFNNITMAPIIIFPHRTQIPAKANDHHTIEIVIKLIHKYYVSNKAQSPIIINNKSVALQL